MAIRRYRMGSGLSVSVNACDAWTVQRAGTIKQVEVHLIINSITDNMDIRVELSKAPVTQIDTQAGVLTHSICEFAAAGNFVTSGLAHFPGNFVVPCNDKVAIGETIYVNAIITGTVAASVEFIISVEE